MPRRLPSGGRLIDRSRPVNFRFNGRVMQGFQGDTLASALLASGQLLAGRSFKYHRPRGIVASGPEEPNALMGVGTGSRFEPNQRATLTELHEGLEARSQNHWPSLETDIGAVNGVMARFLPAGFYYKTFIHPRPFWKHIYEPVIRQSAGLGQAPQQADADSYEHGYAFCDVLVAGGGVAGLLAALAAARAGARVILCEQAAHWGGRALVDGGSIDGQPAADWIAATVADLAAMPGVTLMDRAMVAGVYDHGYALAHQRVAEGTPGDGRPRHRLWRIRAGRIVAAAGAIERPLAFAGNDVPGVMLAGAVRDYLALWGVAPGARTVVVTNNDDAYRTALMLAAAGMAVPAIIDARPDALGPLPDRARAEGIAVHAGRAIARVHGGKRVTGVSMCPHAGEGSVLTDIDCDIVAMSGGWSPAVHLWSHCGGKLTWDAGQAHFAPDPARPPTGADGRGFVIAAGAAAGHLHHAATVGDAAAAGRRAANEVGAEAPGEAAAPLPSGNAPAEHPMLPVWVMPQGARAELRSRAFLDFQNDVKVSDVELAAREGFESVEHAKRYTTLGMATDQGKLSNINGLAVLAAARGVAIPEVGTTTFRPPYSPISMGSMAGPARGRLFKPLRRTPMDGWHDANGAHWEPVGDWRRPYAFVRPGEDVKAAVTREIVNTRGNAGLLDASTLGKILVTGPDAGRFLDLLYTNVMSSLAVGRCRYGLMCTENGFLFDDGVVVRLSGDSFLCHTTSGGSDRVHAWMEEWLQTEWWDLKVWVANLTEQFAQVAVVGPKARMILERLGGLDVSRGALPFMAMAEGTLGGIPARVFRISFSGELSYEIAVPAGRGLEFWLACHEAGRDLGVMPYGTEALHVMRAEKGFIMIGDETDGTVTPQDLNLHWAVSKKKADFIGKRAQERAHLVAPDRKVLVGLLTEDPAFVLPDGIHAVEGRNPDGTQRAIGHVTSTYFSPTLGRSIAMALIRGGRDRMGQVLSFPALDNQVHRARVVDPVFHDPKGEKQDA
jgi:sarcosine oxidase subunit alpha